MEDSRWQWIPLVKRPASPTYLAVEVVEPRFGICYWIGVIQPEDVVEDEWAEWYRLTPIQRWLESEKLWQIYLALGGSLDPEPDTQSPFFDPKAPRARPAHGRTSVRVLRRGRV